MTFKRREAGDNPHIELTCDKCGAAVRYHRVILRLLPVEHDDCNQRPRGHMTATLSKPPPSEGTEKADE